VSLATPLPWQRCGRRTGRAGAAAAAVILLGCATTSDVITQPLPSGAWRLTCKDSLARCLEHVEDVCPGVRYKVLSAVDNRDYFGTAPAEREMRSSEAVVRCGVRGKTVFKDREQLPDQPRDPEDEAETRSSPDGGQPLEPLRRCVPGATQACVGPGACAGAQACLPGGSGFTPCDCSAPPPADGGAPPASADAGATH
jgi:hypothetical protein